MKMNLILMALPALLLLPGCASPSANPKQEVLSVPKIPAPYVTQFRHNTRGIEFGMTCDQTMRLLGPPGATVSGPQYLTWFWAFGPHGLCCHFQRTAAGFALQSWTFTD